MSKKYCKLERLEFQEIYDTVSVKRKGEFQSGIIANGKVILTDKISLDSVGAQIKAGNKVFFDQKTFRTVKVSQDFYEEYTKNRTSLCQIMEGVKSGIISTDEGKRRSENIYLDMVVAFSGIKSKTRANITLVDLIVEQTDSFPELDIKLRNNTDEVVFIKEVQLTTIDKQVLKIPFNYSHVPVSWTYDITLAEPGDKLKSFNLSQEIKSNSVDRFKLRVKGYGEALTGLNLYLIKARFIFNEDDNYLETPEILLHMPAEVKVLGATSRGMKKKEATNLKESAIKFSKNIKPETKSNKKILAALQSFIDIDLSKFTND